MFGMLDYRAHKLLWLLLWPISLVNFVVSYVVVAVATLIVVYEFPRYHPLLKVIIAWVVAQVALVVLSILFWIVTSIVKKAFFWIIDVVPAHGTNKEEATHVVIQGPFFALSQKMETNIHEWTEEDTAALVRTFNWRTRWFFPVRERSAAFIAELRRTARGEGKQPCELHRGTIDAIRKRTGQPDWFETAVTNAYVFHGFLVLAVIAVVVIYSGR